MERFSPEKSRLLVMPSLDKEFVSMSNEKVQSNLTFVVLPHPQTNRRVQFLLKESDKISCLYELNKHQENPSSWLMDSNVVKSDGSILVATPFDPLYILLSCLFQDKTRKYVLLDQLVANFCDLPNIGNRLFRCLKSKSQMNNIADLVDNGDLEAYKYNEVKTLKWLKKKVDKTVSKLKESNIYIEEQENISSDESTLLYSCGMVCDYLPIGLHQTLKTSLGIKEVACKRKIKASNTSSKKAKTEPSEDYSLQSNNSLKSSEKKSLTKAQKALSKVDKTGMKTMSSFFKVKDKKK